MIRFIICLAIFLLPITLYAQSNSNVHAQLSGTLSEIDSENNTQKKIHQQNAKLERELKILQKEMVSLAKDMSDEEQALSDLEEKFAILETQKKEKTDALNARQAELSTMISAMIRLRQLPPGAVIAMPGKLDETLATARALNIVTTTIEEDAESLRGQLHELSELEEQIRKNRETILAKKSALETRQKKLSVQLKEREKLQAELSTKEQKEKERLANLTSKSRTLQDLIDSLEKSIESHVQPSEPENITANAISKNERGSSKHKLRSFENAKGKIRLPVAGKIIRHYGSSGTADNTASRGITINARENATVVAPFDGEVVYAGPFRDYGHMVIIRHSDDYHTMLSGMETVNCKPGQYLLEGEPIGTMGEGDDARHLYMELRKSSKPIDPSDWLR